VGLGYKNKGFDTIPLTATPDEIFEKIVFDKVTTKEVSQPSIKKEKTGKEVLSEQTKK
jgi:hypothetical protein